MSDASYRNLRVPIGCPVCGALMKGTKATHAWYDWQSCHNCQMYFLDHNPGRQKAWKEGWRPNEEQIQQMREHMGLV